MQQMMLSIPSTRRVHLSRSTYHSTRRSFETTSRLCGAPALTHLRSVFPFPQFNSIPPPPINRDFKVLVCRHQRSRGPGFPDNIYTGQCISIHSPRYALGSSALRILVQSSPAFARLYQGCHISSYKSCQSRYPCIIDEGRAQLSRPRYGSRHGTQSALWRSRNEATRGSEEQDRPI